jgi:hypothetical protein
MESYGEGSVQMRSNLYNQQKETQGISVSFTISLPGKLIENVSSLLIIRITWRIGITQLFNNVRQSFVLPADEDVARPGIVINDFLDAFRIVAATRGVDCQAQVLGERFDGLVGPVSGAI